MAPYVRDLLREAGPAFSFEFFPPKTDEGEARLWTAISELESLQPTYVSVTCRASGSTHERTIRTVERIARETSITPVAHLTCSGVSREQLRTTIRRLQAAAQRAGAARRSDRRARGGPHSPTPSSSSSCSASTVTSRSGSPHSPRRTRSRPTGPPTCATSSRRPRPARTTP